MKIRPKAANEKGKRAFLLFLLLAAVLFVISLFMENYHGIVQLFSLVALTTALFFYNRYLASTYEYEITTDTDGTPVFVVSSYSVKRVSTLCRISLWDIREIRRMNKEERRAHQTPKDMAKHNYTPTLFPDSVLCIVQRSRYEKSEIYIESNEVFEKYLLEIVEEARAMHAPDDEE